MRRSYWFLPVLVLGLPAFAAPTVVSFDGLLPLPQWGQTDPNSI